MGLSHGGTEKAQEVKKEQKGPERVPTWFQLLASTSIRFQFQEELVLSDRIGGPRVVSPMGDAGWPGRSHLPRTSTLRSWELPKETAKPGQPQARWPLGLEFGQQLGTYIVR